MATAKRCVLAAIAASVAVCVAFPVDARSRADTTLTDKDKLYWEAAQALYGVGLKIKRTKRSTTIAPMPGGLTQEKYNQYVKEVYLQVLRAHLAKTKGGQWRWTDADYSDPRYDTRGKVKRGHLLLEPYLKYKICRESAARIGNKPNIVVAWQRISWCALQAMDEAIAPIYVYRGKEVTWNAPDDKGDLELDDEIWKPDASGNYPIVVTVAGGSKIYTMASTNILMKLAEDVDENFAPKMRKKADKMYQQTLKIYHKLVKAEARKQRKLAGKNKIIFAGTRFYSTVAQPPAKGPLPCMKTFFLAYAPTKARKQGYHRGIKVDGNECAAIPMDANEEDRSEIFTAPSCSRLLKPGEHKVTVAMHENINLFDYKKKEWRRDNMQWKRQNVTYTQTKAGKLLYESSITCTQE